MGSDMCTKHLVKLTELLAKFEREPKEIKGIRITNWFRRGEDIFEELFNLGHSEAWKYAGVRTNSKTTEVIAKIKNNKGWLESFITLYPNSRINLDLVGSADDICKVRSGIDVLMKGFCNINSDFDKVLKDLEELGEVDEFDQRLKLWIETGHRPDFKEKPSGLSKDHWWWF
ncbi:unnamed protein product [Colias eurytheme]|nr:unnamed protein product [Colias eurytheme]